MQQERVNFKLIASFHFTLREECRLRVFENKVLRRIFGPKRDEEQESGEDYITRSFMLCTPHQISFGRSSQED
jgi:hypothetical protein